MKISHTPSAQPFSRCHRSATKILLRKLVAFLTFLFSSITLFAWDEVVAHKENQTELTKLPLVKLLKEEDGFIRIQVTNHSVTSLTYPGYARESPQRFIKRKKGGLWKDASWDWCGTGMKNYTIEKSEIVIFKFKNDGQPIQIYTIFYNSKNTKQFSLIKLF